MAIEHRRYPIYGLQFHPESILSDNGKKLIQNFLDIRGNQMIRQAIYQLSNKQDLTTEQAIVSMQEIMSGTASNIQIASF